MEEKKRAVILMEQRLQLAQHGRQDWIVNAEEGNSIQDVLTPGYWSHVSARFSPYDRIEVRLETGEWMLELVVLQCDRNWARVHVLHHHDLAATINEAPPAEDVIVKWRGMHHKWCAVRVSDKEVLQANMESQDACRLWIVNYQRSGATTV